MACNPLIALERECGADGVQGGVEKIYMISYSGLAPISGSLTGEVFTISAGGLVSEIGLAATNKYVEIQGVRATSGLTSELTKNIQTNTSYYTNTFTISLAGLSTDINTFMGTVLNQPISVIVKTHSGKYQVVGLNGQFELSNHTESTGTAEGDLVGHTLTFTGIDTSKARLVDPTIIAGLLA